MLIIRAGAQKTRSLNDVALSFFGCHGTFLYLVAVSGVVGCSTRLNVNKFESVGRYPLATGFQLIKNFAPTFKQRLDTALDVGTHLCKLIFKLRHLD